MIFTLDTREDDEDSSGGSGDPDMEQSSGSGLDASQGGIYFSQPDYKHLGGGVSVTSRVYVTERTRGPVRPIVTPPPRTRYTSAASTSVTATNSWHLFMNVFIFVIVGIQTYGLL